MTKEEK